MHKKWGPWDIIILILEILSPTISIFFTCFTPMGQNLETENRLAIIGAGISIPVIILQATVTQGQNNTDRTIQEIESKIDEQAEGTKNTINQGQSDTRFALQKIEDKIDEQAEKINHVSPILEQVFISGNDRVQRFAYRRFDEVCKTIQSAVNNNNSGNLRANEYYEELLYLADLILKDKAQNKGKFNGEIWAMTGFAEEEWIADDGYEKLWTDKLKEMIDSNGIKTRRLCLIPDPVYSIITSPSFAEPSENEHSFWGFIELLESYYGKNSETRKKVSEHYLIREQADPKLKEIHGFFAIKLTNGDLHILYGETVDSNGALTAKVLFDSAEIKEVRKLFDRYTTSSYKLETKLKELIKSHTFHDFLTKRNIVL